MGLRWRQLLRQVDIASKLLDATRSYCGRACSSASSESSLSWGSIDGGWTYGRRVFSAFAPHTARQGRQKVAAGAPAPKYRPRKEQRPKGAPVDAPYKPAVSRTIPPKRREVQIPDQVSIRQLAQLMGVKMEALEGALSVLGEPASSHDKIVSADVAELVALDLGFSVKRIRNRFTDAERRRVAADSNEAVSWPSRPAVVTVMGHVDHGKTSLLDALRQTSVAAKEAGGITQHMGAFVVEMPSASASLTFIDTPGHAAFSAMRARGAAVTDIVVLVVAADDGVMPQTREALAHARVAKVPVVVAINKCDKPGADAAHVRQQLIEEGVELEEIGGDVLVVEVSATEGLGLDKLEEALLLQGEMMDLRSRQDGDAEGVVVEARLDRGQGSLATVIVQAGTLVPGSHVVVGTQWGRVRRLHDMMGRVVEKAVPSTPVEIDGLKGLPEAGDEVLMVGSEERARKVSEMRKQRREEERLRKMNDRLHEQQKRDVEEQEEGIEDSKVRVEVPFVVKADVRGTAEAVKEAVENLSGARVDVRVIHTGVGPISQSDVALAEACGACIVGFNVHSAGLVVDNAARRGKVIIKQDKVIYRLLEEVGKLVAGLVPGMSEEKVAGEAEVLQVFEVKGKGSAPSTAVAGCKVVDGRLQRTSRIRILRSGEMMFEGSCRSLRREKLDVETVGKGTECGMVLIDYNDYCIGDVVQCIEEVMRQPKLVSSADGLMHIEL